MQTCAQAGFCNRNRNVAQGQNFEVMPNSVVLNTATLSATLLNAPANKHLQLTLTSHADGFVRLHVDESPSVGRYQVRAFIQTWGPACVIFCSSQSCTSFLSIKPIWVI